MTAPRDALTPAYLRLGVVGTRRLPDATLTWLGEGLREAFAAAADLRPDAAAPLPLRLVSGMAAGADRLAIDTFLDWRAQWQATRPQAPPSELLALLPCPAPMFRDLGEVAAADDAPAIQRLQRERADFDRQWARLGADPEHCAVLALRGELPRSADPAQQAADTHTRGEAHRQQAQVLIRQVDALIVVLDLRQAGAAGGSRETLEAALAMNTPVLLLDVGQQRIGMPHCAAQLHAARFVDLGDHWRSGWEQVLRRQVPHLPDDLPDDAAAMHLVYREMPWPAWRLAACWEAFEQVFRRDGEALQGAPEGHGHAHGPGFGTAWHSVSRAVAAAARAGLAQMFRRAKAASAASVDEPPQGEWLESWRRRLSGQQQAIMAAYRGAFLGNYLLGLLAVVLALSILVLLAMLPHLTASWLVLMVLLTVVKLVVVAAIACNTHGAMAAQLSQRAVALRYICERLRPMRALVRLGSARLDLLHRTARRGPPADIADDLCRRLPLREICAAYDPDAGGDALRALLDEQIRYHRRARRTMRWMFLALERCVQGIARAVIAVVLLDLVLLLYKLTMALEPAFVQGLPHAVEHGLHWLHAPAAGLGKIAVALTALLPAVMATLNAIAFQSQAEQLSERHHAMAVTLQGLQQQVAAQMHGAQASAAGHALALAERVSALLAEEVAEWAGVYRHTVKEA